MNKWRLKGPLAVLLSLFCLGLAASEFRSQLYALTLDFPLYKNEYPQGGSLYAEKNQFVNAGLKVLAAQTYLSLRSNDQKPRRVFHAKSHGCLTAKFNILFDRALDPSRETYKGLFDTQNRSSYEAIVRFSNGVGTDEHDALPDVRGMAIKLLDVQAPGQSVDLLMTNSPIPFGRDLNEFIQFMEAVTYDAPLNSLPYVGGPIAKLTGPAKFIWDRFGSLTTVFNRENVDAAGKLFLPWQRPPTPVISSLVKQQYWSGHPYLMGQDRAMKFNVQLKEGETENINGSQPQRLWEKLMGQFAKLDRNYLRKDLLARSKRGPMTFVFSVQLETDPELTPIENTLNLWAERESPSIPVAELVIDQQDFDTPAVETICESLRFTPGHYHPDHRPLGNMGRGRIFAYKASQIGRGASDTEPTEADVENLRRK